MKKKALYVRKINNKFNTKYWYYYFVVYEFNSERKVLVFIINFYSLAWNYMISENSFKET